MYKKKRLRRTRRADNVDKYVDLNDASSKIRSREITITKHSNFLQIFFNFTVAPPTLFFFFYFQFVVFLIATFNSQINN